MTLQEVWSLLNLYNSSFSGEQIDEAIGVILNGGISAAVDAAQASAEAAAKSASEAAGSEANVGAAATNAQNAASRAAGSATEAESYAHGGTGKREGEDEDNARYYSEEAAESAAAAAASEASVAEDSAVAAAAAAEAGAAAQNAGNSAAAAENSAAAAEAAADSIVGSVGAAAGSATAAKQSETNAKDSETAAKAAQAAAEAAAGNAARDAAAEVENRLGDYVDDAEAAKTAAEAAQKAAEDARDQAQDIVGGDFIPSSQKGAAGGVASLGNDGKVPAAQLPDIGSGDMAAAVYDPQGKAQDVFAYADTKLSKAGGDMTGTVHFTQAKCFDAQYNSGRTWYDAYRIRLSSGMGALCINLGNMTTMFDIDATIFDYSTLASLTITGYSNTSNDEWAPDVFGYSADSNVGKIRSAIAPDGGKCILIGDSTTSWSGYTFVDIPRYGIKWGSLGTDAPSLIKASILSNETGYTNIADCSIVSNLAEPVSIEKGGTGAENAADARTNLDVVCKSGDDLAGALNFTNGKSISTYYNGIRTWYDIAHQRLDTIGKVGTICINVGSRNTMVDFDVVVASYSHIVNVSLAGYTNTGSSYWFNPAAIGFGTSALTKIRSATAPDGSRCFLIGETTTNWEGYLFVSIPRFSVRFAEFDYDFSSAIKISILTDETGYTGITNCSGNIGVPRSRTINNKALSENIVLAAADVGAPTVDEMNTAIANAITGAIEGSY